MEVTRILVQIQVEEHLKKKNPLGWFEAVYSEAKGDELRIPWANLASNPHLTSWLNQNPQSSGKRALVVGCGLGDDAEELDHRGFAVTAFDISPTAIEWCRRRHPLSKVRYEVVDLLQSPLGWLGFFDFVFEAYTLQSYLSPLREEAMKSISKFLGPQGFLLVVTRGKDPNEFPEGPPWPLSKSDLLPLQQSGLRCESFEDFKDSEDPSIRRFRALYRN